MESKKKPSLPTLKKPEKLVVDANPIVSALLGGASRRIFFEADIQLFAVPEYILSEVNAHLPMLATKLKITEAYLEYALNLLPLSSYPSQTYRQTTSQARQMMRHRDPDDADVLALTLKLGIPLWTNDRDFEGTGVEQFTTARLLAMFFGKSRI